MCGLSKSTGIYCGNYFHISLQNKAKVKYMVKAITAILVIFVCIFLMSILVNMINTTEWGDISISLSDFRRRTTTAINDGMTNISNTAVTQRIGRVASQSETLTNTEVAEAILLYLKGIEIEAQPVYMVFSGGQNSDVKSKTWQIIVNMSGFHIGILFNNNVHCVVHPYGLSLSYWLNDFVNLGGFAVVYPSEYQHLKWRHCSILSTIIN